MSLGLHVNSKSQYISLFFFSFSFLNRVPLTELRGFQREEKKPGFNERGRGLSIKGAKRGQIEQSFQALQLPSFMYSQILLLAKAKPGFGSLLVNAPQRQPRSGMPESKAVTLDYVGKSKKPYPFVFACDAEEPQKVQLGFSSNTWWWYLVVFPH